MSHSIRQRIPWNTHWWVHKLVSSRLIDLDWVSYIEHENLELVVPVGMDLRDMPSLCLVWVTAACAAGQLNSTY